MTSKVLHPMRKDVCQQSGIGEWPIRVINGGRQHQYNIISNASNYPSSKEELPLHYAGNISAQGSYQEVSVEMETEAMGSEK